MDLTHYDLRDVFYAWEVAGLLAGVEPSREAQSDRARYFHGVIFAAFEAARDIVLRVDWVHQDDVPPLLVSVNPHVLPSLQLSLARDRRLREGRWIDDENPVDFQLEEQVFHRADVEDWVALTGLRLPYFTRRIGQSTSANELRQKSATPPTPPDELDPRERKSMLTLIIGLAMGGYKYDPSAARNSAVTDIVNDVSLLGLSISDETVRTYLKEAAQLLPDRKA